MPVSLRIFFVAACLFRVATLAISVRNERRLKDRGAREYGRTNSVVLGVLHSLIYVAALVEGLHRRATQDMVTAMGLALYGVGVIGLVVAIRTLGRLWTLKVLIAPDHILVTHPLFRAVRHPNYYLGVLPELVGLLLTMHAWATMVVGMPLYLVSLGLRIRTEERVMREEFAGY